MKEYAFRALMEEDASQESIEHLMNQFAKDGWIVKAVTSGSTSGFYLNGVGNYVSNVSYWCDITFERDK